MAFAMGMLWVIYIYIYSGVVSRGEGGHGPLEIEICRNFLEILRLSEKLIDDQLKIIRFTMMTYFSTWSNDLSIYSRCSSSSNSSID